MGIAYLKKFNPALLTLKVTVIRKIDYNLCSSAFFIGYAGDLSFYCSASCP